MTERKSAIETLEPLEVSRLLHAHSIVGVFRLMPATSSGACRASIPVHAGPPFRSMPAGGCDAG
jgi:hypothetical protein